MQREAGHKETDAQS
jgi:hypothetical protein